MYKLYYSPGACSRAVHVVLNEIGENPELIKINTAAGEQKKPEFLKINPFGVVPVLVDDGTVILEGAAQIVHLCDKHKSPLLSREGLARTKALQWLSFANATLHPAYGRMFMLRKLDLDDAARDSLVKQYTAIIQGLWDKIETHLAANGPFLAGKDVTPGDILVTVISSWSPFDQKFNFGPKTKALIESVSSRPAFKKAKDLETAEAKAA
jgi:glutathione S-transferase